MWLQQTTIIKWKKQAEKKKGQFMVMDQWVRARQEGKSLAAYFQKHHYKRIAIYGMNHIGKRLLSELQDSDVEVIYGLDQNARNISTNVRVVTFAAKVPSVDAVVITLVEGYDDVSDMVARKLQCPVIAIEDILNEV